MQFNVSVPVKPYVKRFLEINFGNPVDFRNYPRENEMFRRMLRKPDTAVEHMYPGEMTKLTQQVEVFISEREFYRHGWELTKTDVVSFGKYFEKQTKFLMRSVVSTYVSFGMPIDRSIQEFQRRYQMEEEYWPFDSIQKDFYRMRKNEDLQLEEFAYQHLDKLIRINMSNVGIITPFGAKKLEKTTVFTENFS